MTGPHTSYQERGSLLDPTHLTKREDHDWTPHILPRERIITGPHTSYQERGSWLDPTHLTKREDHYWTPHILPRERIMTGPHTSYQERGSLLDPTHLTKREDHDWTPHILPRERIMTGPHTSYQERGSWLDPTHLTKREDHDWTPHILPRERIMRTAGTPKARAKHSPVSKQLISSEQWGETLHMIYCIYLVDITKQPHSMKLSCCTNMCFFTDSCLSLPRQQTNIKQDTWPKVLSLLMSTKLVVTHRQNSIRPCRAHAVLSMRYNYYVKLVHTVNRQRVTWMKGTCITKHTCIHSEHVGE